LMPTKSSVPKTGSEESNWKRRSPLFGEIIQDP
jgi:hypothetical protein